jgi:ribokinase
VSPPGRIRGEILVVGDVMVDVVVVPHGPLQHGSDTPASTRVLGGGSAANTACWLGHLGQPVRLVVAVGDDSAGRAAVADVEVHGAAVEAWTDPHAATGTCVALVDPDGERTMLPDRGANDALPPGHVAAAITTRPPAWLHLSGYALLGEGSRPAGLAALGAARSTGIPCSVDAASAAPLREVGPEAFLDWIAGAALVFANDDELDALGGEAAVLRAVGAVVAKHGSRGATWTDGRDRHEHRSVAATVVDSVGAGDAFDAGYLAGVLHEADPLGCLRSASDAAAQAVSRTGARPPRPASERPPRPG